MTIISHDNSAVKVGREIPRTVFLSAPMTKHHTKAFDAALDIIKQRHSQATILSAYTLWMSGEHWRLTYRDILASVDFCYILTDLEGYVRKRVYQEWKCLAERNVPFVAFLPDDLECQDFTLKIINRDNRQQYAGVLPPEPPFKTSSTFQLIAHAALADPHHWHPTRIDERTGRKTLIPRREFYAALLRKDRAHGEAA